MEHELAGFETPLTLAALAATLRDESSLLQTPVGDDFLGLELEKAVLSQHDLLRHFIMIGCGDFSLPPAGDKHVLRTWRQAHSEPTLGAGLDESSLAAVLDEAVSVARKQEKHWLKKLTRRSVLFTPSKNGDRQWP